MVLRWSLRILNGVIIQIVRGLILSGGAGTRMRPFTHTIAKQLLPVGNQPILHRAIVKMVEAGIEDIVIVVGDTADQVVGSVGDGSAFSADISYVRQKSPLGLAHCVKIAGAKLGHDAFVMYLGDNMFESGLSFLLTDFSMGHARDGRVAQVAVKPVPNPSLFGVATVNGSNQLVDVVEKPEEPPSNLALVGTYLFTPVIHDAIDAISPSTRGELEITDAIQTLVSTGHVVGVSSIDGWWYDTGNPHSFLECNSATLLLDATSEYSAPPGVTLVPPVVIDPTARLTDCSIGPFVTIGPDVTIDGSTVSDSVIFRGGTVRGSGCLRHSIVGQRSTVVLSSDSNGSVVIGDDSIVEVNR